MATGSGILSPLQSVKGVRLASIQAGIRYQNRLDLVIFELASTATTAAVFTKNAFCAAPVQIARQHLKQGEPRYLLINTGNANAGTGDLGRQDALACCQALAEAAAVSTNQVLPFSTGVIGQRLPADKIIKALPKALSELDSGDWLGAAKGIMTTDTRPKAVSRILQLADREITITGIAKGAGMIKPDMATLLSFIFTDASIASPLLHQLLSQAVSRSFNRITVDGDTSTNDSCVLVATGASGTEITPADKQSLQDFIAALHEVFHILATEIIRDAEGAEKFVTVKVINGGNEQECLAVAYAVAESPLVKTALSASDPNWGRILAAIGRAGLVNLDIELIDISLGKIPLVAKGMVAKDYSEAKGQAEVNQEDIAITIDLKRGTVSETVWTSDLSHEYVRINAEYRT
ncbi:MAG: bifunctional glutamate N-acetyltransferase/amino-acid acetyltransferase ArgJ [Pseudohongiellaceae bacterium]